MSSRWFFVVVLLAVLSTIVPAQIAPVAGMRDNTPTAQAFTNARIVVSPGRVISRGTLVIRDGVIEAVGENASVPADARVWDMAGLTLYSGFIDLSSDYGLPKPIEPAAGGGFGGGQQQQPPREEPPKGAAHWNAKMRADFDASEEFTADAKAAEKLRSQGFALVLATPQRGVFRGQSALVNLGDRPGSDVVVKRRVAQTIAFEQGQGFGGAYPGSLMGIIAFTRQSWYDTDWYRKAWDSYNKNPNQKRPEINTSLAALLDASQGRQPVVMEASNDMNFLRQAKIGKELGLSLWIRGSGEEYRRLDAVKATKLPVIVILNFPEVPNVDAPEDALNVTLEDLRHWDAAPENAGRLEKAGVPITLSAATLKDAGTFLAQARKAVERGLGADAALAALTVNPAKWMGVDNQFGSLEKGKSANILVTDGDVFNEKTKVREVWIDGIRYEVKAPPAADARGTWDLTVSADPGQSGNLTLKGDIDKPTGEIRWRGKTLRLGGLTYSAGRLGFTMPTDSIGWPGSMSMSGTVGATDVYGVGTRPDGAQFSWNATRKEAAKAEADTSKPKEVKMASFPEVSPPGEYGRAKQPDQPQSVFVKNATVWTQGKQGKIEGADMIVTRGKITQIGKNLAAPKDALVIDATGKHVTPGMIDAHSHTAAASINEGSQAVTCETRIEDVLESDDIWIYRQLAGGTTAANILHGSANPIGGQNATVKWRWGGLAEDLLIQGAPPGVKFALGENVKQSNSQNPTRRYPQTRMGVEQLIRDRFKAALDYEREWKDWERDKSKLQPRKDLELDAIVEMIRGKRLIHAHSYRQDEILMLMRVCEDFGIKIATLQHILEGYKVADVMAKHGVGASSFSDWWAYKIEAWDAIPGNGPLMHDQGVLVSYNSDNSQLASRLNWEASKAVKFGISEEEALKFVTINPAKQLRIDDKTGSLEAGKDADFVVWSGNPLSVYSKCEQTWVDGRRYFDLQDDQQMREQIQKERGTLIQKVLAGKKEAPGTLPVAVTRFRRPNEYKLQSCMEGVENEN